MTGHIAGYQQTNQLSSAYSVRPTWQEPLVLTHSIQTKILCAGGGLYLMLAETLNSAKLIFKEQLDIRHIASYMKSLTSSLNFGAIPVLR